MLTLRAVYHLPLCTTVGLVRSLLTLLGQTALPVAHFSTLSLRARTLVVAPRPAHRRAAVPGGRLDGAQALWRG